MHPNIPGEREREGRGGDGWSKGGERKDSECCQGLLLDSVVISEQRRAGETKRKFTGVVLSGKAFN